MVLFRYILLFEQRNFKYNKMLISWRDFPKHNPLLLFVNTLFVSGLQQKTGFFPSENSVWQSFEYYILCKKIS